MATSGDRGPRLDVTGRTTRDTVRSAALIVAALLQIAAGAIGGIGLLGERIGVVADSYPTPVLPAGTAFTIWSLIYVLVLALAVRAALPGQRGRAVHRRTGWWLVAAGVLNASWVLVFGQRMLLLAELVIIGLAACLIVVWTRLADAPATDWGDRLLLHTPVTLYTGWVAVASVVGAATTGAALGVAPFTGFGVALSVLAVLGTAALAAIVVTRTRAVVGFALAVIWAFAWIAVATPIGVVLAAVLVSIAVLVSALVIRLGGRAGRGGREGGQGVAWG